MINISNTPKVDVIVAADKEATYLQGLMDTLQLLRESPENITLVENYIQRNAVLKGLENDLKRNLDSRATLLSAMSFAIGQLSVWAPKLRERVVKSKTSTYDAETITFREKGILDAISSLNFFNRYAGMVLNIVLTQADKEVNMNTFLSKNDMAFFNNTAKYFTALVIRFSQSIKDLETMIDDLSEETYDLQSEEILRAQLGAKAVSLRGLAQYELNPLYWWKRHQMKKDIKAVISAEADIDMLAVKIARLNNRRTGVEDPTLDRQIEVYQDELIKRQGKIAQIESRYVPAIPEPSYGN